jgi:hypothetical protein
VGRARLKQALETDWGKLFVSYGDDRHEKVVQTYAPTWH